MVRDAGWCLTFSMHISLESSLVAIIFCSLVYEASSFLRSKGLYMGVSLNGETPKSSILIGFSIINHPFWGTPIFGNTHIIIQEIHHHLDVHRWRDIPRFFRVFVESCGTSAITWNPKQPFINGCFNGMIPNLYVENGCFTKHPFINGCLGFQVPWYFGDISD